MKRDTMERLMALPKASQDKVWQLAMDRLKAAQKEKEEALRAKGKKPTK